MARKRKADGGHGGHGWFVTFADLMALLMSFFVMIAAYSTQDQKRLQLVAGSMRDAFGTSKESRFAGIIEKDGVPTRDKIANVRNVTPENASDRPRPGTPDGAEEAGSAGDRAAGFALAAATLRQALQSMPDIAELSKNIIVEETRQGLDVSLIDQDGRSMFGVGSIQPYDRTRRILESIAPALRRVSQRIAVTGHTATTRANERPDGPAWDLSAGRATTVREILAGRGVPDDRFSAISGKADVEPMFPDNPYLAANRRVTITLLREAPPLPLDLAP